MRFETFAQGVARSLGRAGPIDDDVIASGQFGLKATKRLAGVAFDAIPIDGTPGMLL